MPQIGNVELAISNGGWGGDFIKAPNGDLLLSIDTLDSQPATIERITRIVLTSARVIDSAGNPISRGDHPFFQDYGAGIRSRIGENYSEEVTVDIETRILSELAKDNTIEIDPAPIVLFDFDELANVLSVQVSVTTTTGQPVTTPPIKLALGG